MAEWTEAEYEIAMQQRDDLFPGYADDESLHEEEAENMLTILLRLNRLRVALKACQLQMLQSNNDSEYAREANELAISALACTEGK
jgi:hypothetical protein